MKNIKRISFYIFMIAALILPNIIYAVPAAPPDKPSGGGPGNSTSVSYKGKTTITEGKTINNESFSSTTVGENALLVSGGTTTLKKCSFTKSGDSDGENADFYGTNAAVLVYKNATLNISGGSVTTSGTHANGVFAYGKGIINIANTTIDTSNNNSGGIMVAGGGKINATNLEVKTKGNSSAAIRSDRGGGTMIVSGGTYETNGQGSPAIYSTADVKVSDATLTSTSSEGVVVEGANSVSLDKVTLMDTNNTLNGNSETYKNIFLYQSMSGDASEGKAYFSAKDSTITTNKGDTIFVTNTKASITLENNVISNNDGDFLRIQKGKWGNSGSNGGTVTLKLTNQKVEGNIVVDSISTLDVSLKDKSILKTAIDTDNEAKKVSLSLSKDSVLVLTNDTYIDSLSNEDSNNSNIYLNGYKLYVGGSSVKANNETYDKEVIDDNKTEDVHTLKTKNNYKYYIIGAGVLLSIVIIFTVILKKKN